MALLTKIYDVKPHNAKDIIQNEYADPLIPK